MKINFSSILKNVKEKMEDGWYIDLTDELANAVWSYVLSDCLHLDEALNKLRKGSWFSMFNYEEVKLLELYNGTNSTPIVNLFTWYWESENDYCSSLDSMYEDMDEYNEGLPEEQKITVEEERTKIYVFYLEDRWELLEMLNEYIVSEYGPIYIEAEEDIWADLSHYFHYEPKKRVPQNIEYIKQQMEANPEQSNSESEQLYMNALISGNENNCEDAKSASDDDSGRRDAEPASDDDSDCKDAESALDEVSDTCDELVEKETTYNDLDDAVDAVIRMFHLD